MQRCLNWTDPVALEAASAEPEELPPGDYDAIRAAFAPPRLSAGREAYVHGPRFDDPEPPCTGCRFAERCADGLACGAFGLYADGGSVARWRLAPRVPTRERWERLFERARDAA